MFRADRKAHVTFALVALASLTGMTTIEAQDGHAARTRQNHEQHHAAREWQAARGKSEARQRRAALRTAAERQHAVAHWRATAQQQHPFANNRRLSHDPAGVRAHVIRYRQASSGTVSRTIRPGLVSRTFVSGGHVLYARVYQQHVWHRFGRAFAYETFVPPVRYPALYYTWALAAWSRPIAYHWGWSAAPWFAVYGARFTPYPVYTSPDLWMTDYILSQSMQTAYQAQVPASASLPSPPTASATDAADSGLAAPQSESADLAPVGQTTDAPQSEEPPQGPQPPRGPQAPPPPQQSDTPIAPLATPPAITPQVKAQLDAEIKVQLREQQAAQATPAVLTTQSGPPALRPNHVFFQVVQPMDVASDSANGYCKLSANDYIRRVGGMSADDWMIPVVVELSGSSDCPEGLKTRISLNDLNAMENEQEAQVMQAMRAATESMGPNGPPSGPGIHPSLIADGNAAPDPSAAEAIRQAQ